MVGVDSYNPVTGGKVPLIRMTQKIKNLLNRREKSAKFNNPRVSVT